VPAPDLRLFHRYLLSGVEQAPDSPAITSSRLSLTYRELEGLSTEYATALDERGLRAGDALVLELSPRPEAVALMIAAASRGIVFVNISPGLPVARKQQLLQVVDARAHVRGEAGGSGDDSSDQPYPAAPAVTGWVSAEHRLELTGEVLPRIEPREAREDDTAYIVFTSGSTGKPKGIMMSHRAVVSFWRGSCGSRGSGVRRGVRLGSMSPLQFDFSLLDLGLALSAGGTLIQLPSLLAQQPSGFVRALQRYDITQMNGVPAIWHALLASEQLSSLADTPLDTVLYAGEGFPAGGLRSLRAAKPSLRLVNCFGHSESIACSYNVLGEQLADPAGRVPLGAAAIEGMRMYLVDERGGLVTEPGALGEIYVEGDALFDGYWQDQPATEAALVPSPLSGPSVRAFRSKDLGYRDAAGQHYFHSRMDTQVKLLGNRIELDEIDLHLESHEAVVQAATVLDRSSEPRLVAFVLLAAGHPAETSLANALRRHCGLRLPRYMVPTVFEFVEHIPTSANGKVDRQALLTTRRSS
jgi:acyl-coenzyme A synthetase/AMP-(fatty) acid ligase